MINHETTPQRCCRVVLLLLLAIVVAPLCGADDTTAISGTFHVIWGDSSPDGEPASPIVHSIADDQGRVTRLRFSDELLRHTGALISLNGRRVIVWVHPEEDGALERRAAAIRVTGGGKDPSKQAVPEQTSSRNPAKCSPGSLAHSAITKGINQAHQAGRQPPRGVNPRSSHSEASPPHRSDQGERPDQDHGVL
jgi:hypothetical protein